MKKNEITPFNVFVGFILIVIAFLSVFTFVKVNKIYDAHYPKQEDDQTATERAKIISIDHINKTNIKVALEKETNVFDGEELIVNINESTNIYKIGFQYDENKPSGVFTDLVVGQIVNISHGPVQEKYPMETTANIIEIE